MELCYQRHFSFLASLLLIAVICLGGCNIFSDDSDKFELLASIEGKSWKGKSNSYLENGTLSVSGINGDSCNYESIYINLPEFHGEGSCPIFKNSYGYIVGCDAGSSFGYSPDTTGTATVTGFNESEGIVEGEFSFELTGRSDHENIKDGEPFTVSGHFRAEIDDLP